VLVSLVVLEVFLRSVFGTSLGFVEEVTGYLVVAITLFGAALAVRSDSLFKVQVIFDAFPSSLRRILRVLFALIGLAICLVFICKTSLLVDSSFSRGKFPPTVLNTPLWIPQLIMPIGFSVIGLFLIEHILNVFRHTEGS